MVDVRSGRSDVAASEVAAPGPPIELRCESCINPLGLDATRPRLSWLVNDSRRGAVQSAYRILVAARSDELREDGDLLWDSGKVESDQSIHVEYEGPTLHSRQRCFWTARTWDAEGIASPWAEPAFWEMGLLSSEDWDAAWISAESDDGRAEAIPMGDWIWHPEARQAAAVIVLRRMLEIRSDARVERALICLAADRSFHLFVNGRQIGHQIGCDMLAEYELDTLLRPGANVIAVRAEAGDDACGLTAGLRIRYEDEVIEDVQSDPSWLCSSVPADGWKDIAFDAVGWQKAAVVEKYGGAPWGELARRPAPPPSICLRREFHLDDDVADARVYVSGLGLYELFINGQRIGEDIFAPGWTDYERRIQYQVHDITDMLRKGPNAIGAILGNGWWAGGLGLGRGSVERAPRRELRFIMRMEVLTGNDGRHMITTDHHWRAHPSPIIENSFYHGEKHDGRLEIAGWDEPGFDDSSWTPVAVPGDSPGRLVARKEPPIRATGVISPLRIGEPADGVFTFDFGQNHAGRCRLRVRGAKGNRIQMRFAERLKPDGTLYTDNLIGARNTDVYVSNGDEDEGWEPRFTYRGYRYVEVTGYPGRPASDAIESHIIHSAPAMTGHFACSDELINRLHANIVWSQRSNMHSVPTDCPQRDERLGWLGDAQMFAPTACWNMDMIRFFAKWMDDIADSAGEDGHVTDVAPQAVVTGPASPGWGDAVVVIPWTLYRFYGDRRIISQHFQTMRGWVEYMHASARGYLYEREGYGDWVAIEASPKKPIGAAYFYLSTTLLARMARIIGRDSEATEYEELAGSIRRAYNAAYFDERTCSYEGGTQTANVIPLAFGLVRDEYRDAVLANIVENIEEHGSHLTTGFLGTGHVLPLLTAMGEHELAWRLVTQRSYPSWGHMIEQGATTMWELWNGDTAGPHMNSHNHFALGSIGQWFYESLAGIGIDDSHPGFKRFIIRPRPPEELEWARAEYRSVHGLIRSAWRREEKDRRFTLDVTVPANTTAEIWVPHAGIEKAIVKEGGVAPGGGAGMPRTSGSPKFMRLTDGCSVFHAGAGQYTFQIESG